MKKTPLFLCFAALTLTGCGESSSQKHTLTFDANGGSVTIATLDVAEGRHAELPIPIKEGKLFRGWYTGFGGNDAHVDNLTPIYEDMTLIAEWDTYDVTFLDEKGEGYEFQTVDAGSHATYPEREPYKPFIGDEYYRFSGWDFDFANPIHKDCEVKPEFLTEKGKTAKITATSSYFEGELDMSFLLADSFFDHEAFVFDRDLAKVSWGLSFSTRNLATLQTFMPAMGFEDIVYPENYDTPTETSIGYGLGHRKIGDKDVIACTIRGHDYGREWSNDFFVGWSGDHTGFTSAMGRVRSALKAYADKYKDAPNKVYWITGYSRGAGVANLLANELLRNDAENFNEENLYAYTFECPRAVSIKNAVAWKNVFNLVDGADPIPRVLPAEYGLTRAGTDVDITSDRLDEILIDTKEDFKIAPFTANLPQYEDESSFTDFIIDQVISYGQDEYAKYKITREKNDIVKNALCDRDLYVDNYQDRITYLLSLVFGVKPETRQAVMDDLKAKMASSIMELLAIISSGESLFAYLKPFLDEDGIEYDEAKAIDACAAVPMLLSGPGSSLIVLFLNADAKNNLSRMLAHHYPEVNYALVKAYV